MIEDDKLLHMIGSAFLTLLFHSVGIKPVVPTLAIGAVIETVDLYNTAPPKECLGDFIADVAGIGLGLLIINIWKRK